MLPGAVEVVEEGVVSTLQGQNERDNAALVAEGKSDLKTEMEERRQEARFRLLFDPQVRCLLIFLSILCFAIFVCM